MKQLGTTLPAGAGRPLVPSYGAVSPNAMLAVRQRGIRPPVANRETDLLIPRSTWSSWIETGRERQLRRALTAEERAKLEARRAELAPWVGPYHDEELDDVALALVDMYHGFPSFQGQSLEAMAAKTESVGLLLRREGMPLWAIEKACARIRAKGFVKREGNRTFTERHWPPSDAELVEEVRIERKLYGDAYDEAERLLAATVEA